MQVRRGSGLADDEVGRALVAAYFREHGPPTPKVATYLEEFPARLVRYVLAWEGPEAVGFAGLREIEPGVGEVKRLYVVPEHRRRGVATALLAAVADEARRHGYRALRLDTLATTGPAIALYESLGWRPIPPWDHSGDEMVAFERDL